MAENDIRIIEKVTENDLIADIENKKEAVLANEFDDLDRLAVRTGAMNQRFTVHIFAMNVLGSTRGDANYFRNLVSDDDYDLSFGTIKEMAADKIEGQVGMYRSRYHLKDTSELLEELSEHIREVDSEQEFVDIMLHLEELLSFTSFMVADRIPWHDLGVAFEGRSVINKELIEGRLEYDHESQSKTLK